MNVVNFELLKKDGIQKTLDPVEFHCIFKNTFFRRKKAIAMTGQRHVDPSAVIFIRQNQTGNDQRAITGISEAGQRRKQYQAGVAVTSTGSEFQGKAVRGQTQK